MQTHRTRNVFFAYSWDVLTSDIYTKQIYPALNEKYPDKRWAIRSGSRSTTSPKLQGQIEEFRNQNKQLFEIFARNILLSDIFIADVTSLNPNVLLELGIAIRLNKNVLIVSGISTEKMPFDLKGFNIQFYESIDALKHIIFRYLETFLDIKEMDFDTKVPGSHFSIADGIVSSPEVTIADGSHDFAFRIQHLTLPRMKDVKVRVKFRIKRYFQPDNWFGFLFRSEEENGHYEPVSRGSLLVNSRVEKTTDITLFPGNLVLKREQTNQSHNKIDFHTLEVTLTDNYIKITVDNSEFDYYPVNLVEFGHLYLACYQCDVEYKELEVLNIDTVSEIT